MRIINTNLLIEKQKVGDKKKNFVTHLTKQ